MKLHCEYTEYDEKESSKDGTAFKGIISIETEDKEESSSMAMLQILVNQIICAQRMFDHEFFVDLLRNLSSVSRQYIERKVGVVI